MNRILGAGVLAIALGGSAMAQTAASSSSSATTGNSVTLAKPPAGTAPPTTKRLHGTTPNLLNNTPLTPQIARQPTPTIGSGVPIAGPGGTSTNPAGY